MTRTVAQLADDLRRLGVAPGATVMVHASLRRIGPVEGGADGVLDALAEVLGPDGTLLMTMGARNDWEWIDQHPEEERAALLRKAEPFDCLRTPVDPDVGTLAEVFRTRPGTEVSDHPEGRFGAAGAAATALVADVPWDDYYGPGSPLERLVERGGQVLRLGADPDTVTLLHHAEYLTTVEPKRTARRDRLVLGPDGPVVRTVRCLDDSAGIVAWPEDRDDYFIEILRAYLATGRARQGQVGDATSELLDAADLVAFGTAWMDEHLPEALA